MSPPPENQANSSGEKDSPTQVTELVVNLDDTTGEVIGDAVATLLAEGALDVWTTPIQMKKQRPGVMLSVLCAAEPPEVSQAMAKRILELTGSFGVRFRSWNRMVLDRSHVTVSTRFGDVPIKVGQLHGNTITAQPEFEAVKQRAASANVPVHHVMDAARAGAGALLNTKGKTS